MAAPPPPPLDSLVRKAATAPVRADQLAAIDAIIQRTYPTPATAAAFNLLRNSGATGTRLGMEFVARMPEPIPAGLLLLAAQVLQIRTTPVPLRLAVAGKLLASVPDTPQSVGPIVRSVTAGLSKSRTLERMIQLQSKVETCKTLDEMVRTGEKRVRWRCPRCGEKLTRAKFIRHLWDVHRLRFDRGAAYDPRAAVEQAVNAAAAGRSAEAVEEAFTATTFYFPEADYTQVLQGVSSRQVQLGGVIPGALAKAAAADRAGLCPSCLTAIPDPIPQLPPPLTLSDGRLAGDGFAVEVTDTTFGQTATARTPDGPLPLGAESGRYGPRGYAVIVTLPLLLVALVTVSLMPVRWASPGLVAAGLCFIGWFVYYISRAARDPLPTPDDRAVEIAWDVVAPQLGRSRKAVRFLTRLCRVSAGTGSIADRVPKVWGWVEQAEAAAEESAPHAQFLAAIQVLQAFDGVTFGKDKLGGLTTAFGKFFRGETSAAYAEAAAEFVLMSGQLTAGELLRVGVLILAEAFDSGLLAGDLARVLKFLPMLRRLIGRPTPELLHHRYVVWRGRHTEPWASVGKAVSIFELVKSSPAAARRILAVQGDVLFKLDLPDSADRDLGDSVMTPAGVLVAGRTLTDPTDTFEFTRSASGSGWWLVLGSGRVTLSRRPTTDVVNVIREWVKYWANKQVPQAQGADRTSAAKVAKLLSAVAVECPLCGTACACRAGKVADRWPLG